MEDVEPRHGLFCELIALAHATPSSLRASSADSTGVLPRWCDEHRLDLHEIEAVTVAAYIEQLGNQASKPTFKQLLAAIRQLFDYLTTSGILEVKSDSSRPLLSVVHTTCCL